MRKRILSLAMVFLLMLSVSAQAMARWAINTPVLDISGGIATCSVNYRSEGNSDDITITLSLKENGRRVAGWSDSGTGSVTISEEYDGVESGNTYKLVLHAVVNGTMKPDVSVTVKT